MLNLNLNLNSSNFFFGKDKDGLKILPRKISREKKHEKMPQYFARLIVSLSSQVVVQFQILVTLYLYSVS